MTSIPGINSNLALGTMQAEMAKKQPSATELAAVADKAEIKKVAEEFESLFVNLVVKSMRETVHKSGLVDGGNAEDIYRGMLDDEYSKMMAAQRNTGIADQIEDFMLRSQGLKDDPKEALAKVAQGASAGLKAYQDATLQKPTKQATMEAGGSPRSKAL